MVFRKNKIVYVILILAITLGLVACKAESEPPAVPVGKAIDVTQPNTSVEFDFKVKEAYKYDVVLEVFKNYPKEELDKSVWTTPNAHLKIHLKSLDSKYISYEQETKARMKSNDLKIRTSVNSSYTEKSKRNLISYTDFLTQWKTEEQSYTSFLLEEVSLKPGNYKVVVENVNPILTLNGRLVKVIVVKSYLGK